jgi:hypothetical protein
MWILVFLFVLSTPFGRSETPPVRHQVPPNLVSQTDVRQWLRVWQSRLGLSDWNVEVKIVRISDLNPDTLGHLKWNSENRTATIKVLDPVDYDLPVSRIPEDIEITIVHELLHLQLSVLPRDKAYKAVEERVVQRMTKALFDLEKTARLQAARLADRSEAMAASTAPEQPGKSVRAAAPGSVVSGAAPPNAASREARQE